MHLSELKAHHVTQLVEMAVGNGIENASRMRKQDLIFAMLKSQAKKGVSIFGDGTLEVLPDGFGFLRSPETSYLASTDDIYVSPSQIRRFNLHTGDSIEGEIRTPKDGERYFALVKVDKVNGEAPEAAKNKILFENLTPLHPDEAFKLEREIKAEENITGRVIDIVAPIGKGQRGLIVSPPKAGKTVMLQHIAHAIVANHPEVVADRAADRRAAGGSDRDVALGARRGRRLHLRRAGLAPRAGRRDGDREGEAPGRAQEGRRSSCSTRSPASPAPTTPWCRPPGKVLTGGVDANALQKPEALLRRGAQRRGRRLADHHRHRADRHRQPHGRRDLRGIQGHRQHGDPPRPPDAREAHLPGDQRQPLRHAARGAADRRSRCCRRSGC